MQVYIFTRGLCRKVNEICHSFIFLVTPENFHPIVSPKQLEDHLFTSSETICAATVQFLGSKVNFFVPVHKPMTIAQGFDKTAYNFSLPMKCKNSLWSGFISNTLKCFENVVSFAFLCELADINFRRTIHEQMIPAAAKESIKAVIIEHLFET